MLSVIEEPSTRRSFDVTQPANPLPCGSASTIRTFGLLLAPSPDEYLACVSQPHDPGAEPVFAELEVGVGDDAVADEQAYLVEFFVPDLDLCECVVTTHHCPSGDVARQAGRAGADLGVVLPRRYGGLPCEHGLRGSNVDEVSRCPSRIPSLAS